METGIQNNILKELVNLVSPESIASGYAPKRLPFVTEPLREVQQPALIIPSAY
jgi:hypothetical protein